MRCREPSLVVFVSALAACASAVPPEYAAQLARLEAPTGATPEPMTEPGATASPDTVSFDPSAPLPLAAVTHEVLAKNPRLDAMRHTWRAMLAMAPQVSAMPDPTLEVGLAPLAIHTGRGQRLSFRQTLPWPGSRGARAMASLTEASAMEHDLLAMKRELVAMAHMSYWELAAAPLLRALWHKHHALIETLRAATLGRIQANKARPQDAVRAESELVMAEQMLIEVDRMERVAMARLNTAMRREPDAPLGIASLPDALPPSPPPLAELTATRAELDAALVRIKARESQVVAVEKMNRPMLGWGVELSTMGDDWMMWPMLMVMVELPLASERRDAMLDEAKANVRVAKSTAEALESELRGEVAERRAELALALARHDNFSRLLVPTLERRLSLLIASYGAGQDDFDAVMMAATALNDARVGELEARVRAFVAATGLELALGRLVRKEGEAEQP